ncbi:MAG: thioesterase family protein [Pseudomonadota bacterium]
MKHTVSVPEGWDIGGNTNGGVLMMLALEPMAAACQRDCALSLTGHFLRPVSFGEAEVVTEIIKEGRMLATVGAEMQFNGKPALRLLGAFGDKPEAEGLARFAASGPPALPPLSECRQATVPPMASPFFRKVEIRTDPAAKFFLSGEPSGRGDYACWISPLPGTDTVALKDLPIMADGFPPPVFDLKLPVNWVPTVELTVHARGVPAPGWLRARIRTRFVQYGLLEEEVELWDESDQLVCQSRQLALVPRPRAG